MPIAQFRMTGYNPDVAAHELPADQWSALTSMVPNGKGGYRKCGGAFDHGNETPDVAWLLNLVAADIDSGNDLENYWLYGGEVGGTSKVYIKEADTGTDTDITNTAGDTLHDSSRGDDWTGGIINGFPVVTVDAIKDGAGTSNMLYWPGTDAAVAGTPDVMVALPGQRTNYRAAWLRPHKFHLFAGHTISTANNHQPDEVLFSSAAPVGNVPQTWVPAAGNEAGDVRLSDSPGPVVDGLSFGNRMMIYKHHSVYAAEYVGGNAVFAFTKLSDQVGVVGRHCAANSGPIQYLLTPDDVVAFDGFQFNSIAQGKIRNTIFDAMYAANVRPWSSWLTYRPDASEVWVCIPVTSTNEGNTVFVYNTATQQWGDRAITVAGAAHYGWRADVSYKLDADEPRKALHLGSTAAKQIHEIDRTNTTVASGAFGWICERQDLDFGDRHRVKTIRRIWPRITSTDSGAKTVSIKLGARNGLDEAITYNSALTFDPNGDQWLDEMIQGKFISVHMTDSTSSVETVHGFDIEYEMEGEW